MSGSTDHRDKRIADYVRNQADDESARQLEIDMLDDDELFERVQAEALLRKALEQAEEEEDDQPALGNAKRSGWIANAGWALAAAFAAVAILLGIHTAQLDERIEQLRMPSAGLPVVTLFEQRSALLGAETTTTSLNTGANGTLIEIDVSTAETDRFRLLLETAGQRYEWTAVARDQRGYVTMLLPPNENVRSIQVLSEGGDLIREYEFSPQGD